MRGGDERYGVMRDGYCIDGADFYLFYSPFPKGAENERSKKGIEKRMNCFISNYGASLQKFEQASRAFDAGALYSSCR